MYTVCRNKFRFGVVLFIHLFIYCANRTAWFTCWTKNSTRWVRRRPARGQTSVCHLRTFSHCTAAYAADARLPHPPRPLLLPLPQTIGSYWNRSATAPCWSTSLVSSVPLRCVMATCCHSVPITSSYTETHWAPSHFQATPWPTSAPSVPKMWRHVRHAVLPHGSRRDFGKVQRMQRGRRRGSWRWSSSEPKRMRWWTGCSHWSSQAATITSSLLHICSACASDTQLFHSHPAALGNCSSKSLRRSRALHGLVFSLVGCNALFWHKVCIFHKNITIWYPKTELFFFFNQIYSSIIL